ncbi:MAG: hypothetical protein PHR14_11325 [Oscillospiraceae bacterium]|nr:hypothetical protein [Oscillospiraceae bacterium]
MGMCQPSGGINPSIVGRVGQNIPDNKGNPNSRTDMFDEYGDPIQSRWYGPDRHAIWDRDFQHHDNRGTHKFPHDHSWDYSKKKPRQKPEEPDFENFTTDC